MDVFNEVGIHRTFSLCTPEHIHKLIDIAKNVTLDGRRLLVSASTKGRNAISSGKWCATEDFSLPHGNICTPGELRKKIQMLKESPEYKKKIRPIMVNEDSVFTENMDAMLEDYVSWGFYCQGYGSNYKERIDWSERKRETDFSRLSGFQTVPVNWGINTQLKRQFFHRVKEITEGN